MKQISNKEAALTILSSFSQQDVSISNYKIVFEGDEQDEVF